MEALRLAQIPSPPPATLADTSAMDRTTYSGDMDHDNTYNPNTTVGTSSATSVGGAPKSILKKKAKPKLTNKEKKERSLAVERVVSSLPLEFRGNDPNLRRHIEIVIEGFFDREGRGVASMSISTLWYRSHVRLRQCRNSSDPLISIKRG